MDPFAQSTYLIQKAHNILILPPNKLEGNSLETILDLYYTLKKIGKNVNLSEKELQGNKAVLEKEFILSVNVGKKEIRKMYYEKKGSNLNIHLGLFQGKITKSDISIEENLRAHRDIDLIISLGRKDISPDDDYGFFSQKPIINIDNKSTNKIFGQVNLVFLNLSLGKIISNLIERIEKNEDLFNKSLFRKIIEKLSFISTKGIYFAMLQQNDFLETKSKPKDLASAIRELKLNPYLDLPNLVLLWEYHHSLLTVKGICFDKEEKLAQRILEHFPGEKKGKGAIFQIKTNELNLAKEKILKIL